MNSLNLLKYDLVSILTYGLLVTFGIINIFSSSFNESFTSIFDSTTIVGKQVIFLIVSGITFIIIIFTINNFFDRIAPILYFTSIVLLLSLFIFGVERGGAKSWYLIGPISFQPTEFAKLSTALFLAKFLSIIQTDLNKTRDILIVSIIILIPTILITFQPDPGSALIFLAFMFPILREGLDLRFFYFGLIILSTLILTLIFGFITSIIILSILSVSYTHLTLPTSYAV